MKNQFSILMILFFSGPFLSAQSTLQNGLIAYYPLDGDALDYSGNGNHGTPQNGASLTTDRNGNPNSAYLFDGNNDYIRLLANNKFEPYFPLTMSAWVLNSQTTPQLGMIFENDDSDDEYYGVNMVISSAGKVAGGVANGASSPYSSRRSKLGTSVLLPNTWYHVAVVMRSPTDMRVYVNGKKECGGYSGGGYDLAYYKYNPGGAIGRGDANLGVNNYTYYKGKIDEVRFYERALSLTEIRELAEAPSNINDVTICQNEKAVLNAGFGNSYAWTPSTGLSCTNCPFPYADPGVNTTYTSISYAGIGTGCPDTTIWNVKVDSCTSCKTGLDFGISTAGGSYIFTPTNSTNTLDINNIRWRFGDGNSLLLLPGTPATHSYSSMGLFEVCAIANIGDGDGISACSDTVCKMIEISVTNIEEELGIPVEILPNPVTDQLIVTLPKSPATDFRLSIYDSRGRYVFESSNWESQFVIPTYSWAKGVYIITLQLDEKVYHKRIMK